ncbi:uncharacterized protein DS421_6g180530 [Arachis hypogaea]|nr:uncharacterized protein DS421_6g180530 [Arachis hypogaea]
MLHTLIVKGKGNTTNSKINPILEEEKDLVFAIEEVELVDLEKVEDFQQQKLSVNCVTSLAILRYSAGIGMMKDQTQGDMSLETMILIIMMQEASPIHQVRDQDYQ